MAEKKTYKLTPAEQKKLAKAFPGGAWTWSGKVKYGPCGTAKPQK
jgi:hypothetical protein